MYIFFNITYNHAIGPVCEEGRLGRLFIFEVYERYREINVVRLDFGGERPGRMKT